MHDDWYRVPGLANALSSQGPTDHHCKETDCALLPHHCMTLGIWSTHPQTNAIVDITNRHSGTCMP
eukprot:14448116-Ditylum_brightwellii.AAC.1